MAEGAKENGLLKVIVHTLRKARKTKLLLLQTDPYSKTMVTQANPDIDGLIFTDLYHTTMAKSKTSFFV